MVGEIEGTNKLRGLPSLPLPGAEGFEGILAMRPEYFNGMSGCLSRARYT